MVGKYQKRTQFNVKIIQNVPRKRRGTIRSQVPLFRYKVRNEEKVQRLDGCGSDGTDNTK